MLIIGCDFHPGFQQVAIFDNLTGEIEEKRLHHRAEAEQFYRSLAVRALSVVQELGFELWLGDAARVGAAQAEDGPGRDTEHLLQLLRENRFPRIVAPECRHKPLDSAQRR